MSYLSAVEYLNAITDVRTGGVFACTDEQDLALPTSRRSAVFVAIDAHGAIDALVGEADPLDARTITATIVKVFGPGDTFTSVWNDFMLKVNHGREVQLTIQDADGTLWYINGKANHVDKHMVRNDASFSHIEIPVAFICPDPFLRAQFKPGQQRLDTGFFLDSGRFLDVDPDHFALSTGSATTTHTITNTTATADDEAPVIRITGPLPGPITIADDALIGANGLAMQMNYALSIAAGETVTFDCETPDVTSTLSGVDAYAAFSTPGGQDGWFLIGQGAHTIRITGSAPAANPASATINYLPRKL